MFVIYNGYIDDFRLNADSCFYTTAFVRNHNFETIIVNS